MRKILVLLLLLALLNPMFLNITYAEAPSTWALNEVAELRSTKYFESNRFNGYKQPITRLDFIYFASRLFEIMSGQEIQIDPSIKFSDTSDIWALKGATIKITSGVGGGKFDPDTVLTREQFSTMIIRTMQLGNISLSKPGNYKFADDNKISSWAKEAMYIAKENNILSGIGNNLSAPNQEATVEQSVILINRILKNNKGKEFKFNGKTNVIPYEAKTINIITIDYNVGKYNGEVKDSIPHGYGIMVYPNGETYEGQWEDGMWHEQGTFTKKNEGKVTREYIGEFKNGKREGEGIENIIISNGKSTYIGQWKNDKKDGEGTITTIESDYESEYIGDWKNGYKDGHGTFVSKRLNLNTQTKYVGEWKEGEYYGLGTSTSDNNGRVTKRTGYFINTKFIGENIEDILIPEDSRFISNEEGSYLGQLLSNDSKEFVRSGYGIMTYKNNDKYVGQWEKDLYDGMGKYIYSNGSIKEGKWKNGKFESTVQIRNGNTISQLGGTYTGELLGLVPHGYGTLAFSNGNKYEGDIQFGTQHGKGTFTWSDGVTYVGEWKHGKYHGYGVYTKPEGSYSGEHKDNLPNGYGTMVFSSGERYEGEFLNGYKHGKGTYTFSNGSKYVGEWKNDKWNGFGKFSNHKGTYTGEFKDDMFNGYGTAIFENGDKHEGKWENWKLIPTR